MSQAVGTDVDIRDIVLSNNSFGPAEIQRLAKAISRDFTQFSVLRDAVGELESREERTPAAAVRLGVCYYLLGRFPQADCHAVGRRWRSRGSILPGQIALHSRQLSAGHRLLQRGEGGRLQRRPVRFGHRRSTAQRGDPQGALNVLDQLFGPIEQTAEYLYQRGATVAALGSNPREVVALYERAVETHERHPGALFGLAMENDRRGNDEAAMDLYRQASECFPTHVGVLLNLGLMYEDCQKYDRAQFCYQRILDAFPDHPRARLFLKDSSASRDMFYDEEAQKRSDRLSQILSVPVTDFELSVRSRNCLQKMGVRTLGDLTRTTEQELLSSKNFGETSLLEIREMLAARGLAARAVRPRADRGGAGLRHDDHVARRTGAAGTSDLRPESFGAGPQVHGASGPDDDRRTDPQDRGRPA